MILNVTILCDIDKSFFECDHVVSVLNAGTDVSCLIFNDVDSFSVDPIQEDFGLDLQFLVFFKDGSGWRCPASFVTNISITF